LPGWGAAGELSATLATVTATARRMGAPLDEAKGRDVN